MDYHRPVTIEDAIGILASSQGITRLLAGGTDVLVQLKSELVEPDNVIDIKAIESMCTITQTDEGFRIGAGVSSLKVCRHEAFSKAWPGVVDAAGLIGSTQVRGRATLVGNLCNASPAADSVPAMTAVGALAIVQGARGERRIPVESIATAPGKTILEKDELVTAVLFPQKGARSSSAYLRFIPRTEMDIAVASAGVCLSLDDQGIIIDARIALGAVAARVLVVSEAAQCLVGSRLEASALDRLGRACSKAAMPINDKRGTVAYRKHVVGVLARRAATIAYQRAGGVL